MRQVGSTGTVFVSTPSETLFLILVWESKPAEDTRRQLQRFGVDPMATDADAGRYRSRITRPTLQTRTLFPEQPDPDERSPPLRPYSQRP